jgi:hypothetical protein
MTTLPDLPGLRDLSGGEQRALVDMAGRLGANPDDIAYVIGFETGPRTPFSPAARNPASGCTGLIQFCREAAAGLGTTLDELAAMSFAEQLGYVERYFKPFQGRLSSLEATYLAVFWPAAMSKDDDFVIASQPSLAYEQNPSFDRQGRGYFTRGDVVAEIRAYAAVPRGRISVPGAWSLDLGSIILLGAVAGAGVAWYSQSDAWGARSRRDGRARLW